MTLVGEGDERVVFDIDDSIRADVEKFVVNNSTFDEFKQAGATQQLSDTVKARIEGYLMVKHRARIFASIFEAGKAIGLKNGSNVGATAPFQTPAANQVLPVNTDSITADDDAKAARLFGGR
jgi:hypothetical protein